MHNNFFGLYINFNVNKFKFILKQNLTMKNIKLNFSMVVLLLLFLSTTISAQMTKAEITATGLTCSMCSNAIFKQLKTIANVKNIDTDLNANTFIVTFNEGNAISPKILKDKVEKAGFFIGSLVITANTETINATNYIRVDNSIQKDNDLQIRILDKGYVTTKEFKKLSKTYQSVASYAMENEDDFHIKIVK